MIDRYMRKEKRLVTRINQKIKNDLPAILPELGRENLVDSPVAEPVPFFRKEANETQMSDQLFRHVILPVFDQDLEKQRVFTHLKHIKQVGHIVKRKKRSTSNTPRSSPTLEQFFRKMREQGEYLVLGERSEPDTCFAWAVHENEYKGECVSACRYQGMAAVLDDECLSECANDLEERENESRNASKTAPTLGGTPYNIGTRFKHLVINETDEAEEICVDPAGARARVRRDVVRVKTNLTERFLQELTARYGAPQYDSSLRTQLFWQPVLRQLPKPVADKFDPPNGKWIAECIQLGLPTRTETGNLSEPCYGELEKKCVMWFYLIQYDRLVNNTDLDLTLLQRVDLMDTLSTTLEPITDCIPRIERSFARYWKNQLRISQQANYRMYHVLGKTRNKRSPVLVAASLVSLAKLVSDGIGTFMNKRNTQKLQRQIETLIKEKKDLMDKVQVDQKQMSAVVHANAQETHKVKTRLDKNTKYTNALQVAMVQLGDRWNDPVVHFEIMMNFTNWLNGVLRTGLDENLDYLEEYDRALDQLLTAIDSLSTGTLTHTVLPPSQLKCYLQNISRELEKDAKHYELAVTEINKYYDIKMIRYIGFNYTLFVNIPVFLKTQGQVDQQLYKMTTVPIPIDAGEMTPDPETRHWKGRYSQIKLDKPYLVVNDKETVRAGKELSQQDLDYCTVFGSNFYCHDPPVQSFPRKPSCGMSILQDDVQQVTENCEIVYIQSGDPEPVLLTDDENILLINMPLPWSKRCSAATRAARAPDLSPAPVVTISRKLTCQCELLFGPYSIPESLTECDFDDPASGNLKEKFSVNAATVFFFRELLESKEQQVDEAWPRLIAEGRTIPLKGAWINSTPVSFDFPDFQLAEEDSVESRHLLHEISFTELRDTETKKIPLLSTGRPWWKSSALPLIVSTVGVAMSILLAMIAICNYRRSKRNSKRQAEIKRGSRRLGGLNGSFEMAEMSSPTVPNNAEAIEWVEGPSRAGWTGTRKTPIMKLTQYQVTLLCLATLVSSTAAETTCAASEDLVLKWNGLNLLMIGCMLLVSKLTITLLVKCIRFLRNRHRTVLMRGVCPEGECRLYEEKCDIFLQISTFSCHTALRLYLGTVLGPPMGIDFFKRNAIESMWLTTGILADKLHVKWGEVGMQYQGKKVPLPEKIVIRNLCCRRKARHFAKGENANEVLTNLAVVYDSHLLIRPVGAAIMQKEGKPRPVTTYFQMEPIAPTAPPTLA